MFYFTMNILQRF